MSEPNLVHSIPHDAGAATTDEVRAVYENILWALEPLFVVLDGGELPLLPAETARRLGEIQLHLTGSMEYPSR
jgi:hypothetical protein